MCVVSPYFRAQRGVRGVLRGTCPGGGGSCTRGEKDREKDHWEAPVTGDSIPVSPSESGGAEWNRGGSPANEQRPSAMSGEADPDDGPRLVVNIVRED
jgi:hypothetical protein